MLGIHRKVWKRTNQTEMFVIFQWYRKAFKAYGALRRFFFEDNISILGVLMSQWGDGKGQELVESFFGKQLMASIYVFGLMVLMMSILWL